MKAKVNKDACIGCGACAAICEDVFTINDEGFSEVKKEEVPKDKKDDAKSAAEACPTGAVEVEE